MQELIPSVYIHIGVIRMTLIFICSGNRTCSAVVERSVYSIECRGFESHPRQLIFLWKRDCLGCAVLLCLVVCLTLLASFFLPCHLS